MEEKISLLTMNFMHQKNITISIQSKTTYLEESRFKVSLKKYQVTKSRWPVNMAETVKVVCR